MSTVLITGASSGFGEAIAHAFLDAGHSVVATMRDPAKAPVALKARIGPQLSISQLDVVDPDARRRAVADFMNTHSRLDVLINNAGIAPRTGLEDTPNDLLRQVFETNYFGPCELMRLVLPIMREQGGGRIVNMSAIGAILTTPLMNAYCSSKHALDSTSAALDLEVRPFGIRVTSVLPGRYATALGAKSPQPPTSAPYIPMRDYMDRGRAAAGPAPTDLTPVTEATLKAATDPDPLSRYLVTGGLASTLVDILPELERLHEFEARRAGVGAAAG